MKKKFNQENLLQDAKIGGIAEDVIKYIIRSWNNYDCKKNILSDVIKHGCVSGVVSEMIYYRDTLQFYNKHKEQINTLIYDLMQETGIYDFKKLFKDFDETDPLILETRNQNLMAWFGFEEICTKIYYEYFN